MPEQKKILERIRSSLGMDESAVLHYAFMEYAKSISLITERVRGKIFPGKGFKMSSVQSERLENKPVRIQKPLINPPQ